MNLLQEFCRQIGFYVEDMETEKLDVPSLPDYKDFCEIDGEEGDFGIIRYYSTPGNQLLAVKTVHGGDNEDVEFTKLASELLQPKVIELLKIKFKNANFTD